MNSEPTLINFVWHASVMVQGVLVVLLAASVYSWVLIFQRRQLLKAVSQQTKAFETEFWSGVDLSQLYQKLEQQQSHTGLAAVFQQGLKEFTRLRQTQASTDAIMQGTERAMRAAAQRELDALEQNLSFLATVGSTAPYVGLFGTVWGIMTSFQALGNVQQATIAMVAPGISEALIATAMGLFAAIPAVVAYNRYNQRVAELTSHFNTFQEEFATLLHRELFVRKADET